MNCRWTPKNSPKMQTISVYGGGPKPQCVHRVRPVRREGMVPNSVARSVNARVEDLLSPFRALYRLSALVPPYQRGSIAIVLVADSLHPESMKKYRTTRVLRGPPCVMIRYWSRYWS